jgi:hypothetical protein
MFMKMINQRGSREITEAECDEEIQRIRREKQRESIPDIDDKGKVHSKEEMKLLKTERKLREREEAEARILSQYRTKRQSINGMLLKSVLTKRVTLDR